MRRYAIAFLFVAVVSAPLSAELKYTSKMTIRAVEGAAAGNDMMGAMLGPMMLQMFGGQDGVEMEVTLNEDGRMRTDYKGAFAGMPAGTVIIMGADGTSVGYDAKAQTWWKIGNANTDPRVAAMMAEMKPDVSVNRTGEFDTIAGLKAERVSLAMTMPIPVPEGADQLPPQVLAMIPKELRVDGETWVASAHAKYAKGMARMLAVGPMANMGLDKLMASLEGFSVRQVMRISLLAGYEMETLLSQIAEEDVPDSVFDVPAGLREIPMPTPNIR